MYTTTRLSEMQNNQKKRCMFRLSSNRREATKYMEQMNHRRATRNLKLTMGMLLGTMHAAIQMSCATITAVTGCVSTSRDTTLRSSASFNRNRSMMPTMSGSVGSATPMPPRSNCSRLMESGVAKTMKSRSRSTEATMAHTTTSAMGTRFSQ